MDNAAATIDVSSKETESPAFELYFNQKASVTNNICSTNPVVF